jgi:hypothetical protein
LLMETANPMNTLREVIDGMRYVVEMKQAYPNNVLIQSTFRDPENPLPGLHISSISDREAVLHELRQYIEETGTLLHNDTEAKEYKAFLAALVEKVAEDVEQGKFGNDPVIEKAQREYLDILKQQFSLPI